MGYWVGVSETKWSHTLGYIEPNWLPGARIMKNLPDEKQQALFHKYVLKWQRLLNLDDWRIEFSPKPSRSMAQVQILFKDRLAVYRIGTFGNTPITEEALETTALHELLHVLCEELTASSEEDQESSEHRVVNTLEKLLMRLSYPTIPGAGQ